MLGEPNTPKLSNTMLTGSDAEPSHVRQLSFYCRIFRQIREGLKGQALRELLATSKVYKPLLRLDVKKCKARMALAVFI